MKILFINTNQFKEPWPVVPIGLLKVATYVKWKGYQVEVLDLCFSKKFKNDIKAKIDSFKPDIVAASIRNIDNSAGFHTLFLLSHTKKIIDAIKNSFTGPIIVGGPAVSINTEEILEYLDLKYAVRGDGEEAFHTFLKDVAKHEGVTFRGEDGTKSHEPMRVKNMDKLPFVDFTLIDLSEYVKYDSPVQIQTKRGCALKCSYCTYNHIEGGKYRLRDPNLVVDEIQFTNMETGVDHFEIVDSCFNIPLNHSKAILKEIYRRKLNVRIRTMGFNPGAIDDELVDLLRKTGFQDLDVGIESGSDTTLRGLNKNFNVAQIYKAERLLHANKIPLIWYLLIGGPYESINTLIETLKVLKKINKDYDLVNFGIGLRVYKGAPLAGGKAGMLEPVTYEPEASLDDLKVIIKYVSLHKFNYFMYDEDEETPNFIKKMLVWLNDFLNTQRPAWEMFSPMQKVKNMIGVMPFNRAIYYLRHKKLLDQYKIPELLEKGEV